jgi:flagellar hook assembly protein FlgD
MLGQEVAVLHSGSQRAGVYRVFWNGTNTTGASVASGLYFYKLQAAGSDGNKFVAVKKMLYLK